MLSVDAGFEVQVFGCGTSGASGQGNGLSGTDSIAAMDQVLDVVAVDGFQPESVAYDDDIAVGAVVFAIRTTPSKAQRIVSRARVLMSMPLCPRLPRCP